MIEFVIAVIFLLITPGPGVLTTAGIGAAFGYRAGLGFLGGLMFGGFINMMIVVSGLAALVLAIPSLRIILLLGSVSYLVYLAWRIASAGSNISFKPASKPLGFMNGMMLQFINPKAYVVGTTLFSGFAFMPENPFWEVVLKILIFNIIWLPIHLIWLQAGAKMGSMNLAETTQRRINVGMALALLIVVFTALWASI
ncbi:LysE family transporter [Planktotalea sp.]|uniref:LysE family translocator n=1 Tax=Planktotalea sp. TaxID=2029877 RepID=UPI0032979BB0